MRIRRPRSFMGEPDQLAKLREEVEARCPVSDNITNATPVSIALAAA